MSVDCETAHDGNFYVVRWHVATTAGCDRVIREISDLHSSTGAPITYLGIMPADMARIDEDGRKALMKLTDALAKHTELAAVAMEARGFAGAATRSLLQGIMMVQGLRTKIKFVDSVAAAMKELSKAKLPPVDAVKKLITRVGGTWDGA